MANWYERHIVPHIIRLGCGCQRLAEFRRPVVAQARGRVLELGIGAGANMPLLPAGQIDELIGIEPSAELCEMARSAARAHAFESSIIEAPAEQLPFDDASFDTVLCTFTLCTVNDPARVLAEARRVLCSDGRFLFCEHGRAPDAGVARWQARLDPFWRPLAGGCHLSRPVRGTIEKVFSIDQWEGGYMPGGPRIVGWMESGRGMPA